MERSVPISSLRHVAAAADELILCADVSTVFRRAVELARNKLGIERGAIFIEAGEYLKGTYGTNLSGQTTCEDSLQFLKIAWFDRLQQLQAEDTRWTMFQDTHWEWDGEKANAIGEGWIALTPIRFGHKLMGIFVNDAAINKSPVNPIAQEVVAVFCSLLGNIIEQKQAEEKLKITNHELERRVQERVAELANANAVLEAKIYQKKLTEKVLAHERNLLRTLIDNLPDYIFAKDTDGRFMISNIAHAQAAGISNPQDFIGKTAHDFFPEELAAQYEADDRAVLQSERPFVGIERVTLDASGEPIWVSTTKVPLQDESGQIIGIVGISRDITAYKRTREALQKQEAFLRQIIDTNPNLIFVKDDQGKFTLVNKAHAAMFGTTPENLIGKTDADFGASEKQVTHYLADDREVMRTLQTKVIPEEIVTDMKMGTDSWFQTIKVPLIGADGKAEHVLGVSTNITARKQAEEALAKERNLLRTLIDYLPDAIYIKDAQGRLMMCNRQQTELILKASGLSSFEEVRGKTDLELFPDNGAQYVADEQLILQTGIPLINKEEPLIRLDGSSGWHLTSKIPFYNPQNQVIGLVGIGIDITERKKAAEALAQERSLLRTVIDALPDLIYAKHRDSRLLLANDAFLQDQGMSSETELIGKTDFELHPLELAQQYYADDQRVMHSGCSIVNQEEPYKPLYGEAGWLLTTKVPLRDPDGNIIGLVGVGRDVTERKQIEAALQQAHSNLEERVNQRTAELSHANDMLKQQIIERQQAEAQLWQSQQMLQSVMDNIPIAIFWKDRHSAFLGCNRQFAHDMGIDSPETLVGKTDYEMPCTREEADFFRAMDQRVMHSDRAELNIEEHLHKSDGSAIWLRTSKIPLHDPTGNVVGVLGIYEDVTERKLAEELLKSSHEALERQVEERTAELRAANEEVKRFAYIVSHDLRSPLVNIKGFASELRVGLDTVYKLSQPVLTHLDEREQEAFKRTIEEDLPEALTFINSSADRMSYFTNAILELSRLGRHRLHLEPVQTSEIVDRVLESLAHQITAHHTITMVKTLPDITADRTALEQIFGNLLTNAVSYLDPDRAGEIEISGEKQARETIFHIRDNGRGIAEEDSHKVFEPFRRAGKPTVPGEGMGLAYVQTLIRRHNGRIWFTSQPNIGTTFSFTIFNQLTEEQVNE